MNGRPGKLAFLLSGLIALGQVVLAAESPQPVSMSAEEFGRLSAADQRALLVRVFQRRLELAKNVYVESTRWYTIHTYRDGQIGDKATEGTFRRFRYWRLNDSYRMDTHTYRDPQAADPSQTVSSAFYGDKGVGRYTVREPQLRTGVGRIDTLHDTVIESNRYAYWLDGEFAHKDDFLFRDLLDHRAGWAIDVPAKGDTVQLTVPWQPSVGSNPSGKRGFVLDPQKGFLPVKGHSRWDRMLGNKPSWRVEDFVVQDSRLVGDVWMPTKLKEEVWASSVPDQIVVYDIRATDIKTGTVTPEDLHVPFTEGMQIVDAVKGVSYVADAQGNPAGPVEPVMDAKPPEPAGQAGLASPQGGSATWRYAIALISLGLLVALFAWLFLRRVRRKAG